MWLEGTIGIPEDKTAGKKYIAVHYVVKVYDLSLIHI